MFGGAGTLNATLVFQPAWVYRELANKGPARKTDFLHSIRAMSAPIPNSRQKRHVIFYLLNHTHKRIKDELITEKEMKKKRRKGKMKQQQRK